MKIVISRKKVANSLAKWREGEPTSTYELPTTTGFSESVTIDTQKTPRPFLIHLLDDVDTLTERQRSNLYLAIHGTSATIEMVCSKPNDVHTMITGLKLNGGYNAELQIQNRWYLVKTTSSYHLPHEKSEPSTTISIQARICDIILQRTVVITPKEFRDDAGEPISVTGVEILRWFGLRHVQQSIVTYEEKCREANRRSTGYGSVVGVNNAILVAEKRNYTMNVAEMDLGSPSSIKKVVLDPDLETEKDYTRRVDEITLPFVRAFSMDLKQWVYIDVEDIVEYTFDDKALDWLVLPTKEKTLLSKLFSSARGNLFGDVLSDKHGGMIILANGKTGVGKTLTAEVFAEMTRAPLYIMEMAELGISIERIEHNLAMIFRRVTRWNAILLMDEADVFLAERDTSLERSVIVGIFLRLMDYYRGLLFLTSNRAEVIDAAFKSRITIRIDYPDLNQESRKEIWKVMLHHAGLRPLNSCERNKQQEDIDLNLISQLDLNGRQIRNMSRLIKVLFDGNATTEDIIETCNFACK